MWLCICFYRLKCNSGQTTRARSAQLSSSSPAHLRETSPSVPTCCRLTQPHPCSAGGCAGAAPAEPSWQAAFLLGFPKASSQTACHNSQFSIKQQPQLISLSHKWDQFRYLSLFLSSRHHKDRKANVNNGNIPCLRQQRIITRQEKVLCALEITLLQKYGQQTIMHNLLPSRKAQRPSPHLTTATRHSSGESAVPTAHHPHPSALALPSPHCSGWRHGEPIHCRTAASSTAGTGTALGRVEGCYDSS